AVSAVVIFSSSGNTTAWQILSSFAVWAFSKIFFAIANASCPFAGRAIKYPLPGFSWGYYKPNDLEME
ncbi:MAG: hypothetical protein LBS75_03570, partial [Synergistaceae bacterium]|nr:hypothetical protein [Synergistaceae bacterium]